MKIVKQDKKEGIVLAKIKECIANGNMSTSSVHILIKR